MTKQAYKGIVFDLFGTLALWHPDRLPTFEWQGKTQPSTMGELRHTVAELVTEVPFETFYETFMRLNEELLVEKSDGKEIPSHQRFLRTLRRLDYPDSSETAAIAEKLSLTHMDLLASAVEIPQHYAPFLAELAKQYQVAILSNFDHGATARSILRRDGIFDFFDHVVVSDDHGWRKPHTKIFSDTLGLMDLGSSDVLYVGDSVEDDIAGTHASGIDIAWVNARGKDLPSEAPRPRFEIREITELREQLL